MKTILQILVFFVLISCNSKKEYVDEQIYYETGELMAEYKQINDTFGIEKIYYKNGDVYQPPTVRSLKR